MELAKQYNNFADTFAESIVERNAGSRRDFYSHLDCITQGSRVLDLACGDGADMPYYAELGAHVSGVDASEELVAKAKLRLPDADVCVGVFENLPYADNSFDVVLSKYAIQTTSNVAPCFDEVCRILKPGGVLVYLVTHPFRQYFEKKERRADYFEQKIVSSTFFDGLVTVQEPTHTVNDYLSPKFLSDFDVVSFGEYWDVEAEQIDGKTYPGYFIIKAIKRAKPPAKRNIKLAIFGSASNEMSEENKRIAADLGKYLAEVGVTVVTGACRGMPGVVVESAHRHGAKTVAYSPDTDEQNHHARMDNLELSYFTEHHFVPGFTARSLAMLNNVDGVLVLNGRMGTLSEYAIALEEGIPAAVVTSTGGIAQHLELITQQCAKEFKMETIFETSFKVAVDKLVDVIVRSRA